MILTVNCFSCADAQALACLQLHDQTFLPFPLHSQFSDPCRLRLAVLATLHQNKIVQHWDCHILLYVFVLKNKPPVEHFTENIFKPMELQQYRDQLTEGKHCVMCALQQMALNLEHSVAVLAISIPVIFKPSLVSLLSSILACSLLLTCTTDLTSSSHSFR